MYKSGVFTLNIKLNIITLILDLSKMQTLSLVQRVQKKPFILLIVPTRSYNVLLRKRLVFFYHDTG